MKTHIITGCAGFIGSHLCKRLLEKGDSVVGIDSFVCGYEENIESFTNDNKFRLIKKDIRDLRLEDLYDIKYDTFWHLAARGELYFCRNNPEKAVDININGTINMIKLANNVRVKHFYFSDTSAEYDSIVDNSLYPTKEISAPTISTPMGIYGITKMAAAQFVRSYGYKYGMGTTLFRYTNIYGESMNLNRDIPPVIGSFAKSLLSEQKCTIYGDGKKRRDFLHIDDLTNFHIKALEKRFDEIDSQTFNVGSGENYSIEEIYYMVLDSCMKLKKISSSEILYKKDQPDEAQITLVDITKSRELGWNPSIEIKDGINKTVSKIWNNML